MSDLLPGFDIAAVERTEPTLSDRRAAKGLGPSRDAMLTARKNDMLAAGRNPGSGHELANNSETCGTCIHSRNNGYGRKHWWKCDIGNVSRSATTDIRLKWPACVKWERKP